MNQNKYFELGMKLAFQQVGFSKDAQIQLAKGVFKIPEYMERAIAGGLPKMLPRQIARKSVQQALAEARARFLAQQGRVPALFH